MVTVAVVVVVVMEDRGRGRGRNEGRKEKRRQVMTGRANGWHVRHGWLWLSSVNAALGGTRR